MNEIPTDKRQYERLVQRVQLRMMRSALWSGDQRASWVRYYKKWRKIQDQVYNSDEPDIKLGYVFGLVEQITSKVTEPILKLRPPCNVLPLKMGDQAAADNFKNIARNWYSKPNMQESYCRSKKEMVICGTRFEVDEWQNVQRRGKMWGKVPKEVETAVMGPDGRPVLNKDGKPVMAKVVVEVDAEVERQIPIHYGFNTRYPSIFDVYPEPDRKTIGTGQPTDCSWMVEDMGERSLEEMCREFYVDPHDGLSKPLYDFGALLKDAGRRAVERYDKLMRGGAEIEDNYGPLITPQLGWSLANDYGTIDKTSVYATEGQVDRASSEDMDKVRIVCQRQADEIVAIANGKYVIQRVRDPWHVPVMPVRAEVYTMDPEFVYGEGIIQPIEDELDELDDTHSLSMSNFIRIVNKMVAVREDAIVTLEDFKPRAGGKIRIRGDADVRGAIMSVDQLDPTVSMLQQEANTKGLIEFISANFDGSPGPMGTKQMHKTASGMELIQSNINTRFVTSYRQALINEARRMMSMSNFFSQFQFEKMPFRIYRDDGSTALAEFNKDDIYTQGRGFEFAVEIDPNFGDSQVQRQQDLFLFSQAQAYEQFRAAQRDPQMRRVDLSKLFERVLRNFGWVDSSGVFSLPDMSVSPEDELQILMQGGVVECKGDLVHHIETHLLQLASPMLKKAIEAGKAHPDTLRNLQLVIEQAMAKLVTFVKDPKGETQRRMNRAMLDAGGPAGGAA